MTAIALRGNGKGPFDYPWLTCSSSWLGQCVFDAAATRGLNIEYLRLQHPSQALVTHIGEF